MTATVLPAPASGAPSHAPVDAGSFPPQLRAFMEVSHLVKAEGLLRRARWYYILLGVVLALVSAACAAAFVLLGDSWLQLIVAGVSGLVLTQIAFVAHEAGHRQVLAGGRSNTLLARVLAGMIGLSYSWWETKHTRHHGNPNRVDKDPDIAVDVIAFTADDAASSRGLSRWITQRQGWLFFPLLFLEGLNLYMHSFKHLFGARQTTHRALELALVLGRFALIAVPVFLMLPLGMAFAFLGVQIAVFGFSMGASFAPNHTGMPIVARDARLDFFSKQVRTSRNIRGGWWATAIFGGLNYQIEHHLFPSMPRPHLARAREIVREQCERLHVPYTEESVYGSYVSVIRYLNTVGIAARDPFECPLMAQYRNRA